ncbi:MAG: response regulator [bacterium]
MENLRVLLVDDENELVCTMEERLKLRDIHAEFTLSGAEALERLREKEFDVVVLDIHMPGTSGLDVMKEIKKIHPETEVILLTGRGSEKHREIGLQLGAYDYVVKPINIEKLIEKMKSAAEKKRGGRSE